MNPGAIVVAVMLLVPLLRWARDAWPLSTAALKREAARQASPVVRPTVIPAGKVSAKNGGGGRN